MLLKGYMLRSLWNHKEIIPWPLCSPQRNAEKCFKHLYLTNNSTFPSCLGIIKGNTPSASDGTTWHVQLSDSMFNWSESLCLNSIMIMLLFALCLWHQSSLTGWMQITATPPKITPWWIMHMLSLWHWCQMLGKQAIVLEKSGGCLMNEVVQRYPATVAIKKEMGIPSVFPSLPFEWGEEIPFKHKRAVQSATSLWKRQIYDTEIRGQEAQEQTRIHMEDWETRPNPDFTLKDDKYERKKGWNMLVNIIQKADSGSLFFLLYHMWQENFQKTKSYKTENWSSTFLLNPYLSCEFCCMRYCQSNLLIKT